jgi:tetratricopeptide (TPR) repeat protein
VDARGRTTALVAVAAAAAAVVTVGGTALQSRGDETATAADTRPLSGAPPLALELGLRSDAEAESLRRAVRLYRQGRRRAAGAVFARSRSLEGRVGEALAEWPNGTVPALEQLAAVHPRSALVGVNLGLAHFWNRRPSAAQAEWRRALRVEPDSPYAVRADDLLVPDTPQGLPLFVPSAGFPASVRRLPPARQLTALARAAAAGDATERILYGVALQRAARPVSAGRQFAAAARLAPADPEALTADAVGRFRKSRPTPAFARLGPLTQRFPRAPVVRLHLGLLLLWLGRVDDARPQLERAVALGPNTPHGRQAGRIVRLLPHK